MDGMITLIEGSRCFDTGYRDWHRQRRFLADEIDAGGTILDLGCANGFLLRCLQKWSGQPLIPYGIDIDPLVIATCHRLFPHCPDHFRCLDLRHFGGHTAAGFPACYDYVFWNMPNRWPCSAKRQQLERLAPLVAPGGKLLIAAYGGNAPELTAWQRQEEKRALASTFSQLSALGIRFQRIRFNPHGTQHAVGVIQHPAV